MYYYLSPLLNAQYRSQLRETGEKKSGTTEQSPTNKETPTPDGLHHEIKWS